MRGKYFFSIIVICFTTFTCNAQSWSAVDTGMHLETQGGSTGASAEVYALAVYKDELYAGGLFSSAGGRPASNIARWNGKEWAEVGKGMDGKVMALCVYNNELYAAGSFEKAGEVMAPYIARWNGVQWSIVGGGTDSDIQALAVYKGELYAGGDFTTAGMVAARHVAKWNGNTYTWTAAGHGVKNDVFSLVEHGGELHAGGAFVVKDGEVVNNLFKWNGKRWAGEGDFNGQVAALAGHDGKLIAGGHYGKVNDEQLSFVAQRNDKVWEKVGSGIGSHTPQHQVSALISEGTVLYIGGFFKAFLNDDHRETNNIAQWDGEKWSNLGKGTNGAVYSLVWYKGALYAGGSFSVAGDGTALSVARWRP